jgi:hypothetical protein
LSANYGEPELLVPLVKKDQDDKASLPDSLKRMESASGEQPLQKSSRRRYLIEK